MWTRIFCIESDQTRVERFRAWAGFHTKIFQVRTGGEAATIFNMDEPGTWHGVMFEYDLERDPLAGHVDGLETAKKMLPHLDREVPIYIHSANPTGAVKLEKLFHAAKFADVTRQVHSEMTSKDFAQFEERCLEYWVR